MPLKAFYFEGEQVRVPDSWDVLTFQGHTYCRRRTERGTHQYWVRDDGAIVAASGTTTTFRA